MNRLSPAQRHLARRLAAAAIALAPAALIAAERPEDVETAPYSLLRAQLGEHLRELQNTHSTEGKIAKKVDFLKVYNDHVDTVILTAEAEGKALQDEIFVQVMIWTFDAATIAPELYGRAFEMAEHVLRFGLKLPERFNRPPAAVIAEFVADDALDKISGADAAVVAPFDRALIDRVLDLTAGRDMVDIIPAKLHKASGRLFYRLAKAAEAGLAEVPAGGAKAARAEALKHFKRAYELDNKIGVKKDIEELERALSKSEA